MTGSAGILLVCLSRPVMAVAFAVVLVAFPESSRAQDADVSVSFGVVTAHLEAVEESLIAFRRDLHRHPELSGSERRTARVIAERLERLGFEVRTGVGGHGVIGLLRGDGPGPVVAFRADMDAVRSNAPDAAEYRSTIPGIRHICGHDVHVAVGIGLAEGFAALEGDFPGSVMLVFQPSEETASGAKAMLADGAFASPRPDAVYAFHTAPYEVGEVATRAGAMMASRASVTVRISRARDVEAAIQAVRNAIQGAGNVSRQAATAPGQDGFVLVQLSGGGITGGRATVSGSITTAGAESRLAARDSILARIAGLDLPGVSVDPDYDEYWIEGVTNDTLATTRANRALSALAPNVTVREVQSIIPAFSEDFGSFQREAPGVMYFLGVSNAEAGTVGMPHSPDYVADDGAILVGARAMMAVMLDRLALDP